MSKEYDIIVEVSNVTREEDEAKGFKFKIVTPACYIRAEGKWFHAWSEEDKARQRKAAAERSSRRHTVDLSVFPVDYPWALEHLKKHPTDDQHLFVAADIVCQQIIEGKIHVPRSERTKNSGIEALIAYMRNRNIGYKGHKKDGLRLWWENPKLEEDELQLLHACQNKKCDQYMNSVSFQQSYCSECGAEIEHISIPYPEPQKKFCTNKKCHFYGVYDPEHQRDTCCIRCSKYLEKVFTSEIGKSITRKLSWFLESQKKIDERDHFFACTHSSCDHKGERVGSEKSKFCISCGNRLQKHSIPVVRGRSTLRF